MTQPLSQRSFDQKIQQTLSQYPLPQSSPSSFTASSSTIAPRIAFSSRILCLRSPLVANRGVTGVNGVNGM